MYKVYRWFAVFTLSVILVTLPVASIVSVAKTGKEYASSSSSVKSKSDSKSLSTLNDLMLKKMNDLRKTKKVSDLATDSTLNSYAATRAEEASEKWSHTRPDGSQGCDMIPATKWRGENLSYVIFPKFNYTEKEQQQAADVMYNNLVASPTHYDNMVFKSFTKVGIRTYVSETSEGVKLTTAYMFSN